MGVVMPHKTGPGATAIGGPGAILWTTVAPAATVEEAMHADQAAMTVSSSRA